MSQPLRIFLSLIGGLAIGIFWASQSPESAQDAAAVAQPIGTAWLNALRMTIVPLVVALLVTGIATAAEAARANKLAARAFVTFITILWTSAALGAFLTLGFLDLFPLAADPAAALRSTFATAAPAGEIPPFSEFLSAMIPTNPIAAAAEDAFLPLIVFTTAFAFAITRLPVEPRKLLVSFFQAIGDAMLVLIGWVLWLAPVGVGALAFMVGAQAGTAAFGALVHYILIVSAVGGVIWLLAYPLGVIGGRVSPQNFVRAALPAQAVAISTQSSLASLPATLKGAHMLNVPAASAGVVLPLAVAIFRATGPAMNIAVALYVAHVFGMELTPAQIAAGIAAAAITTMGSVSLPGSISFISSIAPIAIAMGVPIEPLALLVAVETLPDIMRTVGNVTMNLAVTTTVSNRAGVTAETEADALLD